MTIQNLVLRADVRAQGGELIRLGTLSGLEFLWGGDPEGWSRHAPVLFPVVGRLRGDALADRAPMPRHGFARDRRFDLVLASRESVTYALRSDETTLASYPWPFELRITYALEDWTLRVRYEVRNPGPTPMPACLGAHPAFRWPLFEGAPRNMHRILFEREETQPVRRLDRDGFLAAESYPTPVVGRVLPLHDGLFDLDALILDRPASRKLRFEAPGCPALQMTWDGFEHLAFWSRPGAGFVCIEPWQGLPSQADETVPYAERRGTFILQPGERRTFEWSLTITGE